MSQRSTTTVAFSGSTLDMDKSNSAIQNMTRKVYSYLGILSYIQVSNFKNMHLVVLPILFHFSHGDQVGLKCLVLD